MSHAPRLPRGRPSGELTPRRAAVLRFVMRCRARGVPVTTVTVARACDLCDHQSARRILRDLKRLGLLAI